MQTTGLPLAEAADGSEEVIINQGAGTAAETKRMPAALLAAAGTRPSPAELKAAVLAALIAGENIAFTDNGDGTTGVKLVASPDLKGTPTAPTAAPGTNTVQIATTAFVKAAVDALTTIVNGKQGHLVEGVGVHITDNGDGTFTIAAPGGGGGGGLVDGTYGDVVVSGGGTVLSVKSATNATITVPTEVYGPAWSGKMSVPTKDALYNKIEGVAASITGRVAATAVGAANGVASLDATGKVPAAQLPSYVDDVLEFGSTAGFPNPGETGKIYVALDTNFQWRWSGTAYVQIAASPGTTDNVPEGPTNKYYTDVRVRAAVMTGLINTVGTPVATDSLLTVLGKLSRQAFGGILMPAAGGTFTGQTNYVNSAAMALTDASGSHPLLLCQGDNNTVFYSTDASGNLRGVWSVFARSSVATFNIAIRMWASQGLDVSVTVLATDLIQSTAAASYGLSHDRAGNPGQVGMHLYNGGGVTEWLTYQPGHATGDDYRIATSIGGAVTDRFKVGADGTVTVPGNVNAGNFTYTSDRRLKSDIRPLEGDGSAVLALKPSRYVKDGREQIGLIADEVETALPEAVLTDSSEEAFKSVDLYPIVAELIARVQFLDAEVARLKAAA